MMLLLLLTPLALLVGLVVYGLTTDRYEDVP